MRRAIHLVFALAAAPLFAAQPPWTLTALDVEIDLLAPEPKARVEGRATLTLQGAAPDSGPIVAVRYLSRLASIEARAPGRAEPVIERTRVEAKEADVARIRFDEPLPPGSDVTIAFAVDLAGREAQLAITEGFALASWVETWYPVPVTETLDAIGSPAAPGSTTIRMPAGWRSVAPGVLGEAREEGARRIETWRAATPMARSFAAGPLTRVDIDGGDVDVSFFVLEPSPAYADRAALLARAIEAMERRLGPYPYPSWNVVEIPESLIGWAAASEQGFIMVRSSVLANESGALPLFAHEAGHAWWGNRMRSTGPGFRLIGEALAQYSAVVAIEALEGRDAAIEFLRFSRDGYNPLQSALGYFHIAREGDDEPLAVLEGKAAHNLADSKGMWFHHMLRDRLGDARYFATLRALFARFDGGVATLDDFRGLVLEAAPEDDGMERFLAQWLDRTGAPEIDVVWWSIDRGRGIELTLEQRQPGDAYLLDLDLAIALHDGTTARERIRLEQREQTFTRALPSRPLEVRIDPDHRILLWRPEFGPPLQR